jgi:hypothetical protein
VTTPTPRPEARALLLSLLPLSIAPGATLDSVAAAIVQKMEDPKRAEQFIRKQIAILSDTFDLFIALNVQVRAMGAQEVDDGDRH